jgi:D-alanyl-D-alanine carboxypeptidase (penicillin-binding protein 5/6)
MEMNSYAQKLGCTQTTFTNVHGLHDEFQVTTARDMARILSVAAKNETFMAAFSTVNYTVPATNLSEPRELSSGNFMMNDDQMIIYLDSRVTGGRTGVVDTGERNLAVTAEKNGIKLVSIVMGSQSVFSESGRSVITFGSFNETSALLDMGFRGHHPVQLFYKDQVLKQYKVVNGSSYVSTGVSDQVTALLPYGVTYDDLSYRYNEDSTVITAPVSAGDKISTVQVWHNNICLTQADLYALHDVGVKQIVATEEVIEEEETDGISILIAVAVIVILLLVFLFGRRIIFRMIHNHKLRRHRKYRRRSR